MGTGIYGGRNCFKEDVRRKYEASTKDEARLAAGVMGRYVGEMGRKRPFCLYVATKVQKGGYCAGLVGVLGRGRNGRLKMNCEW